MSHLRIVGLGLAMTLALTGMSQAAGINQRERHQQRRIFQGLRSGELTGREFGRLERQQARLRRAEFRYRHNDGRLGPRERADLQRDLNRTSRRIYRQKHDGQSR